MRDILRARGCFHCCIRSHQSHERLAVTVAVRSARKQRAPNRSIRLSSPSTHTRSYYPREYLSLRAWLAWLAWDMALSLFTWYMGGADLAELNRQTPLPKCSYFIFNIWGVRVRPDTRKKKARTDADGVVELPDRSSARPIPCTKSIASNALCFVLLSVGVGRHRKSEKRSKRPWNAFFIDMMVASNCEDGAQSSENCTTVAAAKILASNVPQLPKINPTWWQAHYSWNDPWSKWMVQDSVQMTLLLSSRLSIDTRGMNVGLTMTQSHPATLQLWRLTYHPCCTRSFW